MWQSLLLKLSMLARKDKQCKDPSRKNSRPNSVFIYDSKKIVFLRSKEYLQPSRLLPERG